MQARSARKAVINSSGSYNQGISLPISLLVILGIVVFELLSAYCFGFIVQKDAAKQFASITDTPLIRVINHSYHRGVFSSDEQATVTLNSEFINHVAQVLKSSSGDANAHNDNLLNQLTDYQITYHTHITHGIFAGAIHGYFFPTFSYSLTTISYPPQLAKLLQTFFVNQAPLQVVNVIGIDHSGRFSISSPSFTYEEALSKVLIKWQGLKSVIKYNQNFNAFDTTFNLPLFSLSAPTKGHLAISNFFYKSHTYQSVHNIKVGDSVLTVDQLSLNLKDKLAIQLQLGDVINLLTGISSTQFLNGIDAINPTAFTIDGVSYEATSKEEHGFFSSLANIGFKSLSTSDNTFSTSDNTYGPLALQLSFEHIDAGSFSVLLNKLQQLSSQTHAKQHNPQTLQQSPAQPWQQQQQESGQQLLSLLKTYMTPILIAQPVFTLHWFRLKTPNGDINLSATATTHGFSAASMNDEDLFKRALDITIDFRVPKDVVAYLFLLQAKYLISAGNANLDATSQAALKKVVQILLNNQITSWQAKGYISNERNILSSHLRYKDGTLTLSTNRNHSN